MQCRTLERLRREEKIYKNLKFDKNRQKVTYGCGIVKKDRNGCEYEKMKIID